MKKSIAIAVIGLIVAGSLFAGGRSRNVRYVPVIVTKEAYSYENRFEEKEIVIPEESSFDGKLSAEEAGAIALARVPGAAATDMRLSPGMNDGKAIYNGRIVNSGVVYEFGIDADTGAITEWDTGRAWR